MDLLRPVVRPYAWGFAHAIAELQGRPVPAPGPEAELWMGAHPSAPSGVGPGAGHRTLDAVIAAATRIGSSARSARRGSAGGCRSCSRCCRPTRRCRSRCTPPARRPGGFPRRERARPGARRPGPELRRRLAQTRAAVRPDPVRGGRRPAHPGRRGGLLRALAVDQLEPLAAAWRPADARGMADALASVLEWPEPGRAELVAAVVAACARLAASGRRRSAGRLRGGGRGSPRITRATSAWWRCC